MRAQLKIVSQACEQMASRFEHIEVIPRTPGFGAWIDGVDLAAQLAPDVCRELRRAWLEFGVVFFRRQSRLTPERQVELAYVFGGGPYVGNSQNAQMVDSNRVELLVTDDKCPPFADSWHTDISWRADPPIGTLIQIQEKPAVGGNTCWACTRRAFAALSEPMQELLGKLRAVHAHVSPKVMAQGTFSAEQAIKLLREDASVIHPVVMTHPLTGRKSIYVNELFTVSIDDVHPTESSSLLRAILDWQRLPDFQLHHEWEENGVAVWDNYSTLHYAIADYYPARRVNQRVMFRLP